MFMTTRKVYKRLSNFKWPFLAASLEELITRDPLVRPMRALVQKLNIFRTTVSNDVAGGLAIQILCYEERSICVTALTGKEEDWLKKNPLGGVGEEGLASQLT